MTVRNNLFYLIGLASAAAVSGCIAERPKAEYVDASLYSGFTLVDPEARTSTPESWLIVRGGNIAEIGTGAPPAGEFAAVHDMTGRYALPGMIDAHGHITGGPQRVSMTDDGLLIELTTGDEYTRSNAAIALSSGVTTVRNPGGGPVAASRYDAMLESGEWTGPQALHAGAVHQPPPFGGESISHPQTPEEWDRDAASEAALGMTYYKLYTDLTEAEVAEGVRAAKAHGLIPIAHLNAVSWTRAAELGVQQFEHALPTSPDLLEPEARAEYAMGPDFMTRWWELADLDGPVMAQMIETLEANGAAVDLTLQVNEIIYFADQLETTFPEMGGGEVPDYFHPDVAASLEPNYAAMAAMPAEQLARGKAVWPKVLAFAKLLHESDIGLMIGTDGTGGGATYAHELKNHVLAGIPEWEVLRMATSGNADLMGLGEQTGRIAEGYEADLVFLAADPVAEVEHVRDVALVVADGQAHEPEALLDIARGIAATARARSAAAAD